MKKQEKTFFVQNLTEELKGNSSCLLIDYAGLSVKMQQDLKKRLRAVGAKMLVVKNTLYKIAAKNAKTPKEAYTDTVTAGPTALIITEDDPIVPLYVVAKFAKEFDLPQIKAGLIEGSFQDKESLLILAKLSSKNALVGQALGVISAPLYGLVSTLNANMQNLISVLKQASEKE